MSPTKNPRGRKLDANSKSGKIRELLKTGMATGDIAEKIGCTAALVYNVKAKAAGGGKRKPGRPAKAATAARATPGLNGLDGIIAAVKNSEKERTQMRAALERIQAVIADALA